MANNQLKEELKRDNKKFDVRMDFKDTAETRKQIDKIAKANKTSFSVIIRRLVRKGLEFYNIN